MDVMRLWRNMCDAKTLSDDVLVKFIEYVSSKMQKDAIAKIFRQSIGLRIRDYCAKLNL